MNDKSPMTDDQKDGTLHPITQQTPVHDVAREFIAYYKRGGGCSNCGGLPHSSTCFVGRMESAFTLVVAPSSDLEAILQEIEKLPRIVPSELDGDEQWNRNGEYVQLFDVQRLFAKALGRRRAQTEEK